MVHLCSPPAVKHANVPKLTSNLLSTSTVHCRRIAKSYKLNSRSLLSDGTRGGSRIEIKRGLSSFFLPQPPLFFFILFFFYLLPPIVFHGAQGCRGCWSPPSTHAGSAPAAVGAAKHRRRHRRLGFFRRWRCWVRW